MNTASPARATATMTIGIVLGFGAINPGVQADTIVVNIHDLGAFSEGFFNDTSNFHTTVDLGAGTTVDRITWSLNREAFNPSFLSEMVFDIRDAPNVPGFVTIQGGFDGFGFDQLTGTSFPNRVLADGVLYLRAYEVFDDLPPTPDGMYLANSTLTIEFTPVDDGCRADLNDTGTVEFLDLLQVISEYGSCTSPPCPEDLNGDGLIGFLDLIEILSNWGPCERQ